MKTVMQAYIITFFFAVQRTIATITGLTYSDVYPTPKDRWNDECTNLYWYPRPLPPHCYWPRPPMTKTTTTTTPKPPNCHCAEIPCEICIPCIPCIATCSWCVPGCVTECRPCDTCSNPNSNSERGIQLLSFYEPPPFDRYEKKENTVKVETNIRLAGSDSPEITAYLEKTLQQQIVRNGLKRKENRKNRINNRRIQRRQSTLKKIRDLLDDLKYIENDENIFT